jgi:hypothetical protein
MEDDIYGFCDLLFFLFLRYLPILKTPYAAPTPTTTTLFRRRPLRRDKNLEKEKRKKKKLST